MEVGLVLKIRENKKLYDYLKKHSEYYVKLNRNSSFYEELLSDFKKYNRETNMSKINDAIDNAEMISSILKIME